MVLGNHPELEQLFLNLLLNAHEVTPGGGTVSLDVTRTDTHVTVTVADSGPGIPTRAAGTGVRALLHDQGQGLRPGVSDLSGHRSGPRGPLAGRQPHSGWCYLHCPVSTDVDGSDRRKSAGRVVAPVG